MASGKHGKTIHIGVSDSTMAESGADNWITSDLRAAIVHRACIDYLWVLRGKRQHNHDPIGTKDELERFFHSPWFHYLCGADGDAILEALRLKHKQGIKTIYYTNTMMEEQKNGKKNRAGID